MNGFVDEASQNVSPAERPLLLQTKGWGREAREISCTKLSYFLISTFFPGVRGRVGSEVNLTIDDITEDTSKLRYISAFQTPALN